MRDSGGGDQDVHATEIADASRDHRGHLRLVTGIDLAGDSLAAERADHARGFFCGGQITVGDKDVGAFLSEPNRGGAAIPLAPPVMIAFFASSLRLMGSLQTYFCTVSRLCASRMVVITLAPPAASIGGPR